MNEGKWKTKDGNIIDISDMEPTHIKNTIRWLEDRIQDPYDVGGNSWEFENSFVHHQIDESNKGINKKIAEFRVELANR